jgi:transcriptional regulator with XRE-family HTH domain
MSELYIRLGKALKEERQGKSITLADIASQLKTSESTLERIEDGDVASFQSPVYFALNAKSFAESLGVDYTRTLDAIREDLGELNDVPANGVAAPNGAPSVASAPTVDAGDQARTNRLLIVSVGAIFLLAAGLGAWWLATSKNEPQTPALGERAKGAAESVPVSMDTAAGLPSTDSVLLMLNLVARGSSWVSLMADGDTAVFRTFVPGETLEVAAQRQMILTISSPANIDLRLNGLPAKLADRSGRVSNVVVTPANVRAFIGGNPEPLPGSVQPDSVTQKNAEPPARPRDGKTVGGGTGR